jgi:hypothetical protein
VTERKPTARMEKERETKDDGRYIIYYTFENEAVEDGEERED